MNKISYSGYRFAPEIIQQAAAGGAAAGRASAQTPSVPWPHCDVGKPRAGRHPDQKSAEKREKHERAHAVRGSPRSELQ
jgi:hypothetical protein